MIDVEPVYAELAAESEDPAVTQIESLCLACHGKGITKLLLTRIPHYKEVILTSFECKDCGDKNTKVQLGSMQEMGIRYELRVEVSEDLSRQIVRSGHATLSIPDLDFEVPPDGEVGGEITTVDGVLQKAIDNLNLNQDSRKQTNQELAEQIDNFITRLRNLCNLCNPFTVIVDDPTGNSFVENLRAPNPDGQLKTTSYPRTRDQNEALGIHEDLEQECLDHQQENLEGALEEKLDLDSEVLNFNTLCSNCSRPSVTKMTVTHIPHFKEVVIMATECNHCGFKTNEVKSGGGVSEKGKKYTLHIKTPEDMTRDVLKSETCAFGIPELDLDVGAGILVGKFTTVEGLLTDIRDDLSKNPFLLGDAASEEKKKRMELLLKDIQKIIDCEMEVHFILDDPAGNSFLQSLCSPEKDPQLLEEEYERSYEQNEELGLNDIKTENYAS